MNRSELRAWMESHGMKVHEGSRSPNLSTRLLLSETNDGAVVAVSGEGDSHKLVGAFADALLFAISKHLEKKPIRLVVGRGEGSDEALSAFATLAPVLEERSGIKVELQCDFEKWKADPDDFAHAGTWLPMLEGRAQLELPPIAKQLSERIGHDSFRWYWTVTGREWSGRIEGLQVCRLSSDQLTVEIGSAPSTADLRGARRIFCEVAASLGIALTDDRLPVRGGDLDPAARLIRALADRRHDGDLAKIDREHWIESRVRRGVLPVTLEDGRRLEPWPTRHQFQFPALWSNDGTPKYIDALLEGPGAGDLWVLEIKQSRERTSGAFEYYRHGVVQAALYREFLRRAKTFHGLFAQGKAAQCQAVLAFPRIDPKIAKLDGLRQVASALGVEVAQLDMQD